ncbi:MAG: hypothetical protein ACOC5F_04120 [Candidatus Aminicenantaceae bacterium]
MQEIINWFINLDTHEIVLWALIVLLLFWEFVIKRKERIRRNEELDRLRTDFMKLGFKTELTKKDIGQLYEKFKITEKELERIRIEAIEAARIAQSPASPDDKMEMRNQHFFILKLLNSMEDSRVLAEFAMVYYLNIFKDKDKTDYKGILKHLMDYGLIDFIDIDNKTYIEITSKGQEYLNDIKESAYM